MKLWSCNSLFWCACLFKGPAYLWEHDTHTHHQLPTVHVFFFTLVVDQSGPPHTPGREVDTWHQSPPRDVSPAAGAAAERAAPPSAAPITSSCCFQHNSLVLDFLCRNGSPEERIVSSCRLLHLLQRRTTLIEAAVLMVL